MTQPVIQNFSIPANSDEDVTLTIDSTVPGDTLVGAAVYFRVYEQAYGAPIEGVAPLIEKSTVASAGIAIAVSPAMTVIISFARDDTVELLRNYYFEVTVITADDDEYTPTVGTMTVTPTENRIVTT